MIEDKILSLLVDKAGLSIVFMYFAGKYIYIVWKKYNGNYVSYKEIMSKINTLENNFNGHLSTAQKRANKLEILEKTQDIVNQNISQKINEIQVSLKEMSFAINDLKDFLIKHAK